MSSQPAIPPPPADSPTEAGEKRGHVGLWLRCAAAATILVLVARSLDLREVGRLLGSARPLWVLGAIACFMANRVITAVKWQVLLRHGGVQTPLPHLVRLMFVSMFMGILIPSGLGVDVIRSIQLGRRERNHTGVAASVIADRAVGILALGILSLALSPLAVGLISDPTPLCIVVGVSLALIAGILAVTTRPALALYDVFHRAARGVLCRLLPGRRERIQRAADALRDALATIQRGLRELLRDPRLFARVLFLNLVVQFLRVIQIHLLFHAMSHPVPLGIELVFVPMIILVTLLPVSPFMGIGVKEGAFVYLFQTAGVPSEVALSVSLVSHIVVLVGLLPGAVLMLTGSREALPTDPAERAL